MPPQPRRPRLFLASTEHRDVYHPSDVPSFRGLPVMIYRYSCRACFSPPDAGHIRPQYRVFSESLDVRLVVRPSAPRNRVGHNQSEFTIAQSSGTGRVQRPSRTCSWEQRWQILRNSPKSPMVLLVSSGVGTTVGPRVPLRNIFLLPSMVRPSLSVRRLLGIDRTPN